MKRSYWSRASNVRRYAVCAAFSLLGFFWHAPDGRIKEWWERNVLRDRRLRMCTQMRTRLFSEESAVSDTPLLHASLHEEMRGGSSMHDEL